MKTITLLFLLFLALGLPGCSKKSGATAGPPEKQIIGTDATNEAVTIKISWLPGKRYLFRTEAVEGIDANLPVNLPESLGTQKIVIASSDDVSLSAGKTLPDGGQELDLAMTAGKFFFQPGETEIYLLVDSRQSADDAAADPVSPLLRQLLNVPVKCFMVDGKLVRTEGLDKLTASLKNGNAQIQASLGKMLTADNLETMFDFLSSVQPADPVKIGESWPIHLEKSDPSGTNGFILDAQCTPTGWELYDNRQCIHLEFKGDISAKPGTSTPAGLTQTQIQEGTFSGEAWFDPQLGMLIHAWTVGQLNINTTVLDQTLPAHVNLTSNFRLLDVEDN
jgi:hypothetical protein